MATHSVDPALDVLNRALHGDHGALSLLERTSSIYVLDATDPSNPKTYGGWNFINQAMNEIERNEAEHLRNGMNAGLTGHVQLLATMAQRVARRSPAMDRRLISTCVANAAQYHASDTEAQALIDLNSEIREIVIGRIAAMAFDFSFHRSDCRSAFSDPVAMGKLCSVLAANAVITGPSAVNYLMRDWIIPSVPKLPPFAAACVTYHLPIEALLKSSPAGTRDALQRLSYPVIGTVLAPVLADAIAESAESPNHAWNCRVAATCLLALERWCTATDLSLPQVKHICTKYQMNFVSMISDALYSDSDLVVEAMAELVDESIRENTTGRVSKERMTQARYIMEVEEEVFRSITAEDLYRIEVKEMQDVLGELVSAVGLQRFRFSERQAKGDHGVCRNLTRIAAKVGSSAMVGLVNGQIPGGGSGLLDLLMKAGAHPHVHISSLAIEVLSELLPLDPSFPCRMLPLLQHRAIIPYVLHGSLPSLGGATSGVDFTEFENFRQNILSDALLACYEQNPKYYMDSCTSAVEEFCSSNATVEVSFQLEAALFCLTTVAITVTGPSKRKGQGSGNHNQQLSRCTKALSTKPSFLPANPLALGQLNRFLAMYGSWYTTQASPFALEVAFELSVSTINMSGTAFPDTEPASKMLKEMEVSPFAEAAKAVRIILSRSPAHFTVPLAVSSLGSAWETTYVACNRGMMSTEDREEICKGICAVVAAFPETQREKPYHAFALPVVQCVHMMTKEADSTRNSRDKKFAAVISRLADEITMLSTMVKAFTMAVRKADAKLQNNAPTNALAPSVGLLKELWPCLTHISTTYASHECIASSLGYLLISCMPVDLHNDESIGLMQELFTLATSTLPQNGSIKPSLLTVCEFVERVLDLHGGTIEATALLGMDDGGASGRNNGTSKELGRLVEDLLLGVIQTSKASLGSAWTRDKEQMPRQQSFESKPKARSEVNEQPSSTDVLAAIFAALTSAAKNCPTFLVGLPATPQGDTEHDRLITRAVESAVTVLVESDFEVARSSILFLKSMIEVMSRAESDEVKAIVARSVCPARGPIVAVLISGMCGGLYPTLLDPAASLLHAILQVSGDDARAFYEIGLQQEQFKLGNPARMACANYLGRCCSGEVSTVSLMDFAERVWELHQQNEGGSVMESDQVVEFIRTLA